MEINYHGQEGQDKWVIEDVFSFKKGGFFVDLAAGEPITFSNTYCLEKSLDWNGICIEPNPITFDKLKCARSVCCVKEVVDEVPREIDFMVNKPTSEADCWALCHVQDLSSPFNHPGLKENEWRSVKLRSTTLESILKKHSAPEIIDYLSLDVEGWEDKVLGVFDFNQFKFLCISIEGVSPFLHGHLSTNGYQFIKSSGPDGVGGLDSFYLHKDLL